jgi:hypothetical protein
MLHAIWLFAAEEASEPSKTPFYIAGILLASWAVVLSVGGLRSPNLPETEGAARLIMAISVVLVASAMATAVLTS